MIYSFNINSFWFHLSPAEIETMAGMVYVDQHGDRWFLNKGFFYSEFSFHIISQTACFTSKTIAA